jgi:hypothetical protein
MVLSRIKPERGFGPALRVSIPPEYASGDNSLGSESVHVSLKRIAVRMESGEEKVDRGDWAGKI